MAFSKAKALQEAEKYVSQGKLSQAIKQYLQIVEKDPSDLILLNTVGDLYVRDKNVPEAMKQFHKLAEAYSQEGFTVKAIAIYKKISKLDPSAMEVLVKAGDLYVLQGLAREAREQYAQAIDFYKRKNQSDKAIEAFRKVVALDASSAPLRAKLAELCEQVGKKDDAARAYAEAAELALHSGNAKDAEAALRKAASLDAGNPQIPLLRARLALKLQQPAEAEKILTAVPEMKSDPRARQLLLESYLGAQKLQQAQQLAVEVFRANPADFSPLSSYTSLCVAQGNYDAAVEPLSELADSLLALKDTGPLIETLRQIAERNPRHLPALELLYRVCEKTGDEATLPEVLEGLGHAYAGSGNLERAQWAFQTLTEREPDNQSYKMLLKQVLRKEGKPVEATPEEFAQGEISLTQEGAPPEAGTAGGMSEAEATRVKEAFENSDLYSQYGLTEKAVGELEKVLADYPDQIDIHRRILEICLQNAPERAQRAASELARVYAAKGDAATAERYRNTARSGAPPPLYEPPAALSAGAPVLQPADEPEVRQMTGEPEAPAPVAEAVRQPTDWSAQFSEVRQPTEAPGSEPREISLDLAAPASAQADAVHRPVQEFDLSGGLEAATGPAEAPPQEPEAPPLEAAAPTFNFEDSRIEVDFYLDQGFVEEARNTVRALEEKFPGNPQVEELRQRIEERAGTPQGTVSQAEAPDVAARCSSSGRRAEVPEVLPQTNGLEGESVSRGTPPPESVSRRTDAGSDLLGSLVGELESSLEGLESPPCSGGVPPPSRPAAAEPARVADEVHRDSPHFGDLLEELGEGPGAQAEDDPQTHYDLGVAFREMSLLDEAIGEFQKVLRGAQKGKYPPNFLQACTLLATCFMDKQMPAIAAKWYTRALETPHLDEEATLALHYDLGVAYEQAGDTRTALEKFSEVYSQNIDYRDVAEKIRILRQKS